jgi:hypothetical protein
MSAVFIHVVLISFREAATKANRAWAIENLQALGEACGGAKAGVLFWKVEPNLDQRKSWHLFEFSIFHDRGAFEAFRSHPAHVGMANRLSEFADWAVADMITPLPLAPSLPQDL